MSKAASIQVRNSYSGIKKFSFEELLYEGWNIFSSAGFVKGHLCEDLPEKLACVVSSDYPRSNPAYLKVFWSDIPIVHNHKFDLVIQDYREYSHRQMFDIRFDS